MHVTELDLSPAAFAYLRAADITDVDQLVRHPCDELVLFGFGAAELYEIVCQLNERGLSLPATSRSPIYVPRSERYREMFRLRLVEGRTLADVGGRTGVSKERVRQVLGQNFGLRGTPPTAKARRWAATERRHRGEVVRDKP